MGWTRVGPAFGEGPADTSANASLDARKDGNGIRDPKPVSFSFFNGHKALSGFAGMKLDVHYLNPQTVGFF